MDIKQMAEMAPGVWCEFKWDSQDEMIDIRWFDGKPPPNPTPEMRERMTEAVGQFLAGVRAEYIKAMIGQAAINDD